MFQNSPRRGGWMAALLMMCATFVYAQNNGPASGLSSYVNPFTGDFSYSVPLTSISGPNGESFPVGATYSGGIQMNQEASWVGLGWNLSTGEIRRSVKGAPDDWNRKPIERVDCQAGTSECDTSLRYMYGPMYFGNMPQGSSIDDEYMDLYQSTRYIEQQQVPFTAPDYDAFFVSGPGIGGEMQMYRFDFANLAVPPTGGNNSFSSYLQGEPYNQPKTYEDHKPHFRFKNEPMAQVKAPFYGQAAYDPNCNCYPSGVINPWASLNDNNYNSAFRKPNDMNLQTSTDKYNGAQYDEAKNRMDAAYYVDYWTNQEIDDHYEATFGSGPSTDIIAGFVDFQVVDGSNYRYRSDAANYDPDGIGAFRVTTPSGMTYHYSLPVYIYNEYVATFDLTNDAVTEDLVKAGSATFHTKQDRYAASWKLTAVTGVDYDDTNNNNTSDIGDVGYWVALQYTEWTDNFEWRAPYMGYNINQSTHRHPNWVQARRNINFYVMNGSYTEGTSQLYYLDQIQTSTQTLYFIKGLRDDAHSAYNSDASSHYPKLRLEKVILMDNDDIQSSWFSASQRLSTTDFPVVSSLNNPINVAQFNADQAAIEAASLKMIEFDYDYSLAPELYNNIQNNWTETEEFSTVGNHRIYFEKGSLNSGAAGKLTLNKINTYEYEHEQVYPGYEFTYKHSDSQGNAYKYNHLQHDYFGYYKRTFDFQFPGGYLLDKDAVHVDAWSLEKILTPLGTEITVEMESDTYQAVGFDTNGSGILPLGGTYTFRITALNENGSGNYHTPLVETYDPDAYELISSPRVRYVSLNQRLGNFGDGTVGWAAADRSLETNLITTGTYAPYLRVTGGLSVTDVSSGYNENNGQGYGWLKLHVDYILGGGTRVKRISIRDYNSDQKYSLTYNYDDGIATAEPDRYAPATFQNGLQPNRYGGDRHGLAPAVGYSFVSMQTEGNEGHTLGSTNYHFNNYVDSYKPFIVKGVTSNVNAYSEYKIIQVTEDNSMYGRLKSLEKRDKNGIRIAYTEYTYEQGNDEGANVEEVFYRINHSSSSGSDVILRTVFYKRQRQHFLKKKVVYADGLITTTEYLERDALTGAVTKKRITDPTDEPVMIETAPAFRNAAYASMGSKFVDENNHHFLLPLETEKVYRDGHLVSGTHHDWVESLDVRKYSESTLKYESAAQAQLWTISKSYVYDGDAATADWRLTGENSLTGGPQLLMEQKDRDDFFNGAKFGYDFRYKIAEGSNTNYASFTHCTFESTQLEGTNNNNPKTYFDGEVGPDLTQVASNGTINAHTGTYMAKVGASVNQKVYTIPMDGYGNAAKGLHQGRTYRVSVWVHDSAPNNTKLRVELDGTSQQLYSNAAEINKGSATVSSGSWHLLSVDILVPDDYANNGGDDFAVRLIGGTGGDAYFDDLRVHPIDASVTGYVIDEKRGLVLYSLDADNFYTRYEYDAAGRLLRTYIETTNGEVKISETEYNFARIQNP